MSQAKRLAIALTKMEKEMRELITVFAFVVYDKFESVLELDTASLKKMPQSNFKMDTKDGKILITVT